MSEIIGATFAVVLLIALALVHWAAFRDPYRNFGTQLIDAWYSHWWEPAEARRGVFGFMAAGWFFMTLVFVGALIYEIATLP